MITEIVVPLRSRERERLRWEAIGYRRQVGVICAKPATGAVCADELFGEDVHDEMPVSASNAQAQCKRVN